MPDQPRSGYRRETTIDGRPVTAEAILILDLPDWIEQHGLTDAIRELMHDPASPTPWLPALYYYYPQEATP